MHPIVAVVSLSDSFGGVWAQLADSAGAEARVANRPEEIGPWADVVATIVSVAGVEERGARAVQDLREGLKGDLAVVGASADHRLASNLIRSGATDYFALPPDLEALRSWLAERVDRAKAAAQAAALGASEREAYDFSGIIGRSPGLRAALERAALVIPRGSATILITGETGTGKELVARAIHYNGPRASRPFVEINCTALPATLLEAELFGYEQGAFTDARTAKPGLFEAANGGSILLDEIGDMAPELQAKLLKVLEDKSVRRLGSLRPIEIDVRVMASTHVDLPRAVREGRFREDLFYRLNVIPLHLPPLRDRGDDVITLAEHFVDLFSGEYDLPRPNIPDAVARALRRHPWRGNIRELRNALERAVLLGAGGPIRLEHLFQDGAEAAPAPDGSPLPFPATLEEIEQAAARLAVEQSEGNKSVAAQILGISRSRLYRLLEPGDV